MTPAEIARVALRYADCLLSIAAEMRQYKPLACLIEADCAQGFFFAAALRSVRGAYDLPAGLTLVTIRDVPADTFEAAGEVWRSYGERLRTSVAPAERCADAEAP